MDESTEASGGRVSQKSCCFCIVRGGLELLTKENSSVTRKWSALVSVRIACTLLLTPTIAGVLSKTVKSSGSPVDAIADSYRTPPCTTRTSRDALLWETWNWK